MTTIEPVPQESSVTPGVQLNPTVDPEQARPIPSIQPDPAPQAEPAPAATAVETDPADAGHDRGPSATAVAPREKVEIPAKGTALDVDLEAEINDALSGVGSLALGEIPEEATSGSQTASGTGPAG